MRYLLFASIAAALVCSAQATNTVIANFDASATGLNPVPTNLDLGSPNGSWTINQRGRAVPPDEGNAETAIKAYSDAADDRYLELDKSPNSDAFDYDLNFNSAFPLNGSATLSFDALLHRVGPASTGNDKYGLIIGYDASGDALFRIVLDGNTESATYKGVGIVGQATSSHSVQQLAYFSPVATTNMTSIGIALGATTFDVTVGGAAAYADISYDSAVTDLSRLTFTALDPNEEFAGYSIDNIEIDTVAVVSDYASWQSNHFTVAEIDAGDADPSNDADDDGISNEREYFFGLDPRSPANVRMPKSSVVAESETNYPAITYTRRNNEPSIIYAVKVSYDLKTTWALTARDDGGTNPYTYTVVDGPTDNLDGTETLTLRYNVGIPDLASNKVFLRVTANPGGELAPTNRPNIVFILADDIGWGDLGCYPALVDDGPEAIVQTPHLDRLATSGVRFTQGYANHLVCAPTRAAIMTGRYHHRSGYYGFAETMADFPQVPFLPEPLRDAGYATGMMGKWHISYNPGSKPLDRGFERFFGFLGGEHFFFDPNIGQPMHGVNNALDAYTYDQDEPVDSMDYMTDEFTTRAIDFIDSARQSDRPFFLYLAYNAPHAPLQVPWEDLEPFALARGGTFTSRDIARAMIQRMDAQIGRLMDHLRANGLEENTLVIFAGDNGASQQCYTGGLRARKGYFYEGGIRVPLIVSWPKCIPAGQVLDEAVITHDIFPTALAAAGIDEVPGTVEGVDWLPYVTGRSAALPSRRLYWAMENANSRWAVRDGRWKLVREDTNDWMGAWPIVEPNDKPAVVWGVQLFDLENDPREQHDVASEHPDIVATLQQAMDAFRAGNAPSLATAEVRANTEAMLLEREQNPELYPTTNRVDGAPGHWLGE